MTLHNRTWALPRTGYATPDRLERPAAIIAPQGTQRMARRKWDANNLAAAFLASDWTAEGMSTAARPALRGKEPLWLPRLIAELRARWQKGPPPSPQILAVAILETKAFAGSGLRDDGTPLVSKAVLEPPRFLPAEAFQNLDLPELARLGDLAAWLGLTPERLEAYADVGGFRSATAAPLAQHYAYSWIPKRRGAPRLIEASKPRLKELQRLILRGILDPVPPHAAAYGFRKGRSCIDGAQIHCGEALVLTLDLKDFFLRVPQRRIVALFRCLGYPWAVARCLTGLCTNVTPAWQFERLPGEGQPDRETRQRFRQPHLPQGAPTSPALANLASWHLDRRLAALARKWNLNYSRYADDMTFSGGKTFAPHIGGFVAAVSKIAADEGFALNRQKTRVMGQGQTQRVTGLVVNQHVNLDRKSYDRLKATLHNCAARGPAGQNRSDHADLRAHLDGRITWVENINPRRGHRLREIFWNIDWSELDQPSSA